MFSYTNCSYLRKPKSTTENFFPCIFFVSYISCISVLFVYSYTEHSFISPYTLIRITYVHVFLCSNSTGANPWYPACSPYCAGGVGRDLGQRQTGILLRQTPWRILHGHALLQNGRTSHRHELLWKHHTGGRWRRSIL